MHHEAAEVLAVFKAFGFLLMGELWMCVLMFSIFWFLLYGASFLVVLLSSRGRSVMPWKIRTWRFPLGFGVRAPLWF